MYQYLVAFEGSPYAQRRGLRSSLGSLSNGVLSLPRDAQRKTGGWESDRGPNDGMDSMRWPAEIVHGLATRAHPVKDY
jgi:hypothetical protein